VAGTVELGLDLSDLCGDQLIVVEQSVFTEGAASGRARNPHVPFARTKPRRFGVVVLADRDGFVLLDGGQCLGNVGRIQSVVGTASAIFLAPFGSCPSQSGVIDRPLKGLVLCALLRQHSAGQYSQRRRKN